MIRLIYYFLVYVIIGMILVPFVGFVYGRVMCRRYAESEQDLENLEETFLEKKEQYQEIIQQEKENNKSTKLIKDVLLSFFIWPFLLIYVMVDLHTHFKDKGGNV